MNSKHRYIFVAASGLVALLLGSSLSGLTERLRSQQARPSAADSAFEASQTEKLLGVPVQNFPAPQGLTGLDEIPANARPFRFTLTSLPPSGQPPRVWYETTKLVEARAPDGTIYEAYCGNDDPYEITPGLSWSGSGI